MRARRAPEWTPSWRTAHSSASGCSRRSRPPARRRTVSSSRTSRSRLPPAEPQGLRSFFIRRPAANVVDWVGPATARVSVLTLGDVMLLGVPGEPTALAAARILASLPPATVRDRKVRVVGLSQGYVGYIDTPERVRAGHGEARRAWFGPDLLDRVTRGLEAAVSAGRGP